MRERVPIDYATPTLAAPPSAWLWRVAIAGWAVAAGVAIVCTLGFAVTLDQSWAFAGFVWLGIGGAITLAALVCGNLYASDARAAHHPPGHSHARARRAILLPASNFALAFVLFILGLVLMRGEKRTFALELRNPTAAIVDAVSVRMNEGKVIALGPIASGAALTSTLRLARAEAFVLLVESGGRRWEQAIEGQDGDGWDFGDYIIDLSPPPTATTLR